MKFAKQDNRAKQLQYDSLLAIDKVGVKNKAKLYSIWRQHRNEIRLAVMNAYQVTRDAGEWDLVHFRGTGAQAQLNQDVRSILARFHAVFKNQLKAGLHDTYKQSVLRHAWILDQVTPKSRDVKIPHRLLRESAVTVYAGPVGTSDWEARMATKIDAYHSALMHNLTLGSMNNSSIESAMDEVDATKIDSPAYDLWDSMSRLYDYNTIASLAQGARMVAELNADMVLVEIWRTRGDLRVCDDCDANEGETIEEADGEIPLHPNCNCYYQLVPKSFADLLRDGDAQDKELAYDMDYSGVVPNSIVIRGAGGGMAAQATVDFKDWADASGLAVGAQ